MQRVHLAALMVGLAVAVSTPALAEQNLNTEIAKKHYELGEKLYQASSYTKARIEFSKAYKIEPIPSLLYNIGRCYEVLADLKQAIAYYRLYLKKKPDAKNRNLIEVRLKNLNARLQQQKPPQTPQKKKLEQPETVKPHSTGREADATRRVSGLMTQPPGDRAHTDQPRLGWKVSAGWATLGLGAASLATGVVFGALARSKSDEYAEGVTQQQDFAVLNEIDSTGKRHQTIQVVTLIIGSVAAATGGGLLLWSYLGGKEDTSSTRSGATSSGATSTDAISSSATSSSATSATSATSSSATSATSAAVTPFISANAVGLGARGRF